MVSVIVMLLFLSVIQVCLWIYTRNLLASATAEAAHYAALADVSDFDATLRVADRLGDGLAASTKSTLQCTRSNTALTAEIRCTLGSPGLVGILDGIMPSVSSVAHTTREGTS